MIRWIIGVLEAAVTAVQWKYGCHHASHHLSSVFFSQALPDLAFINDQTEQSLVA